ncbi:hypothetical protein EHQ53_06950 [Leptospira langatensis]|uniref:Uncharacterized protein n=2 Tax=Leptospira langatensis TaxID=2484983 RepID=A0A5F1ZV59_9LEPT|nr:hypothetical protein EHO57_07780 [Leptospira langatensis]TGL42429.1 hypothetical protein EHQ53_06950 [Leptospira langatensis]
MRSYYTGEIVYDPETKEGKHFQISRWGRIEYYRSKYEILDPQEGMDFLCAEKIRWDLEKRFLATAKKMKENPISVSNRKEAAENLKEYVRFSKAVNSKSQIVRNFLFLSLTKYMEGNQGLPISPCGLTSAAKGIIEIAVRDLKDPETRRAWAAAIPIFSGYELGFTMAGYCE